MTAVYILMKNGWPVSVFDRRLWAEENLSTAEANEPKNHWMLLEFVVQEEPE